MTLYGWYVLIASFLLQSKTSSMLEESTIQNKYQQVLLHNF